MRAARLPALVLAAVALAGAAAAQTGWNKKKDLPSPQKALAADERAAPPAALSAAVADSARPAADRARDGARHPVQTLAFWRVKPGGVFGVEEHRADGAKVVADGSAGYVRTADVTAAAQKAGFRLDAASELNANPRDTKDHPFGVWTLPPTRQSSADGKGDPAFDHAKYDAIGESDRMTLRFVKP